MINDYGRKNSILKDADSNLTGEDVREGLTAIVSIKHQTHNLKDKRRRNLGIVKQERLQSLCFQRHLKSSY